MLVAAGLSSALVQRKTVSREHLQTGHGAGPDRGSRSSAALTLLAASVVVAPVFGARTALLVGLMAPCACSPALTPCRLRRSSRRMAFRRAERDRSASTRSSASAVCIGLALAGLGGVALVIGMLAGALWPPIIAWLSAPPPMPRLNRAAARELIGYGLPVSIASLSWVGFSNVDYAIIGARLGALQTGLYFRAYTVAVEYQSKISVVMSQVGFPVLSRTRGPRSELAALHRQMVRLLTIVAVPAAGAAGDRRPVPVPFLFGRQWSEAVVPVQILALGGATTLAHQRRRHGADGDGPHRARCSATGLRTSSYTD